MIDMDATKKNITLPKGGILEVDVTPQFVEIVRNHFGLQSSSQVEDDHIRMYIWGAFKNAIEKAENVYA